MSEIPLASKSPKICNHTSVGVVLVNSDSKILLIDRKLFPLFFACPAGHLEEKESPEAGAIREIQEEVGLTISDLKLVLNERFENPCRRQGGTWHNWWIYRADFFGELKPSERETKQAGWYSPSEIEAIRKEGKLEPVWEQILGKLKII